MGERLNGHDRRPQRAERTATRVEKRADADRSRADRLVKRLGPDSAQAARASSKADRAEKDARRSRADERGRAAAAHREKAADHAHELARLEKAHKLAKRQGVAKSDPEFAKDKAVLKKKIAEGHGLADAAAKEERALRRTL